MPPPSSCISSLSLRGKFFDDVFEELWLCTSEEIDLLAVLIEDESWHGVNTKFVGEVGDRVDVERRKDGFSGNGELVGVPGEDWTHELAGTGIGGVGLERDKWCRGNEGL